MEPCLVYTKVIPDGTYRISRYHCPGYAPDDPDDYRVVPQSLYFCIRQAGFHSTLADLDKERGDTVNNISDIDNIITDHRASWTSVKVFQPNYVSNNSTSPISGPAPGVAREVRIPTIQGILFL